jgi:16S rRNA U516 pseudouridylate synthase RsuA-like enzyme
LRFDGYFDQYERPVITVYVTFPALHKEGNVGFLVDTGADTTALNSDDTTTLGIDVSGLRVIGRASGVGQTDRLDIGAIGALVFTSTTSSQRTLVLPRSDVLRDVEYSLLGRDIIRQFKLYVNSTTVHLED